MPAAVARRRDKGCNRGVLYHIEGLANYLFSAIRLINWAGGESMGDIFHNPFKTDY